MVFFISFRVLREEDMFWWERRREFLLAVGYKSRVMLEKFFEFVFQSKV